MKQAAASISIAIIIFSLVSNNPVAATWRICDDDKTSTVCANVKLKMGGTCWWKFKTMCDTGAFGGTKDMAFLQA
ncbi:hypothetical protein BGW38_001185, partial [Lunasporangiospora selenospora]